MRRLMRLALLALGMALVLSQGVRQRSAAAQEKQEVDSIIAKAPKKGLCVVLSVSDPQALIALAKSGEAIWYAQVPEAKQVQAAREAADNAGVLNSRLYIEQGGPAAIHLASDLADAVFANGLALTQAQFDEVKRVLCPGGVAYVGEGKKAITKPFAADTDDWSHPYHLPDNNPQSLDKVARGPFLTHFMAEPWYGAMPQMSVIAGGKVIKVWGNRTSKQGQWPVMNKMLCMSAFNGTTLWTRPIKDGFMLHRNTLIATPDTVYFGDEASCKLIDMQTGEMRDEIVAPADLCDGPTWCWMALQDGVLYALIGKKEPPLEMVKTGTFHGAGWPWWKYKDYDFGFGRTILAIDPKTKKVLWHHREIEYIDMRSLCMTASKIFFHSQSKFLACLDAKTGKLAWKTNDPDLLKAIGDDKVAQNPF